MSVSQSTVGEELVAFFVDAHCRSAGGSTTSFSGAGPTTSAFDMSGQDSSENSSTVSRPGTSAEDAPGAQSLGATASASGSCNTIDRSRRPTSIADHVCALRLLISSAAGERIV